MSGNVTRSPAREHGRRRWVRPQSFHAEASAAYAAVSPDTRTKLGAQWAADLRRARSLSCSAPPLARVLEQVHAIAQAGDDGFAEVVCAAVRAAATADQFEIDLPIRDLIVAGQRPDVAEDMVETEAQARDFNDRGTMLALADAKSRAARADLRLSAAIRRRFS